MKDEIKIITLGDIFKNLETEEKAFKFKKYITNLQTIEQQYSAILSENAELENKITNLQEENERLKEDIEDISVSHFSLFKQYEDYKSRNEKAIEYIKQYREVYYPDEPLSEPIIQYGLGIYEEDFDEEKLLNILKGEDKQ